MHDAAIGTGVDRTGALSSLNLKKDMLPSSWREIPMEELVIKNSNFKFTLSAFCAVFVAAVVVAPAGRNDAG